MWLVGILCPPGHREWFRSRQVTPCSPRICWNSRVVAGQIDSNSRSDGALHGVRAFLKVKPTGHKVEQRVGGRTSPCIFEPLTCVSSGPPPVLFQRPEPINTPPPLFLWLLTEMSWCWDFCHLNDSPFWCLYSMCIYSFIYRFWMCLGIAFVQSGVHSDLPRVLQGMQLTVLHIYICGQRILFKSQEDTSLFF